MEGRYATVNKRPRLSCPAGMRDRDAEGDRCARMPRGGVEASRQQNSRRWTLAHRRGRRTVRFGPCPEHPAWFRRLRGFPRSGSLSRPLGCRELAKFAIGSILSSRGLRPETSPVPWSGGAVQVAQRSLFWVPVSRREPRFDSLDPESVSRSQGRRSEPGGHHTDQLDLALCLACAGFSDRRNPPTATVVIRRRTSFEGLFRGSTTAGAIVDHVDLLDGRTVVARRGHRRIDRRASDQSLDQEGQTSEPGNVSQTLLLHRSSRVARASVGYGDVMRVPSEEIPGLVEVSTSRCGGERVKAPNGTGAVAGLFDCNGQLGRGLPDLIEPGR